MPAEFVFSKCIYLLKLERQAAFAEKSAVAAKSIKTVESSNSSNDAECQIDIASKTDVYLGLFFNFNEIIS